MRRIELRPAAVAALCLLFYLDPWHAFVPFVLACALHEAGHLVALFLCGCRVQGIRVSGTGALIVSAPLPPERQVFCALAGPAVNLLSFFAFTRAAPHFAAVSALLAAYNLLPIEPLDGGTALRCALERRLSPDRADRICSAVRAVTLSLFALGALWCCFALRGGVWALALLCILLLRLPKENPVAKRRTVS